jgi:16S rRNA (cytidine1402-2'-O)-methyltransferase
LVICATPIGNLGDVTLRVLDALREADVIACEDTRVTRKLLARHEIKGKQLISYREHNERQRARELVKRVDDGLVVALVSDAGMPAISDPGVAVIDACHEAGLRVEVLPGPSAVTAAVTAAGMVEDRWCFVGFLPRRKGELSTMLRRGEALVAFESPRRLATTLELLAGIEADRPVAVCRELTKLHEEVVRGSARELATRFAEGARGEIVLVIGPAGAGEEVDLEPARAAVDKLVEAGAKRRAAASVVSSLTGLPANRLY